MNILTKLDISVIRSGPKLIFDWSSVNNSNYKIEILSMDTSIY